LSDKPATGYGFDEVTADLRELIDALHLPARPILAGQSWGGNVVLDFAARYPREAAGLVLVDGGFLEISDRPEMTWERASIELRPPELAGIPREKIEARLRQWHPSWSDEGIEGTLGNFELLPDGTVRPWLSLNHHMQILRALWEHRPSQLYAFIQEPVLIAPAEGDDAERMDGKRSAVRKAEAGIGKLRVHWFPATDHDIHVQRPRALAGLMTDAVRDGFLRGASPQ
jgi:pimeloyl-ACP methyl ester carboxylesterase